MPTGSCDATGLSAPPSRPSPCPIRGRAGFRLCSILAAAVALSVTGGRAGGEPAVNDVKAEMLVNVAKFVEWPAQRGGSRGQLMFVILGEDELAGTIAALLSTKSIRGRQVFVRCVRRLADVKDAQVLFVAASEQKRIPEALLAVQGLSVLTVADVSGFAAMGGMVEFVQQGDKVRLEINPTSAERARLKISAKLLALAKIVAHSEQAGP